MHSGSRTRLIALMSCAAAFSASLAHAATPAQRCEAGKVVAAGRYGLLRQDAAADLVKSGDSPRDAWRLLKIGYKFNHKWQSLENDASATCGTCSDEPLDPAEIPSP